MTDFFKNNKVAIIGAVVVMLGGYVYYAYFSGNSDLAVLQDSSGSAVSQDLLSTLSSLRTIHLDTSVFSDPSFQSLSDFGVTLPPQQAGRTNPFLSLKVSNPTPPPSKK